jgi:rRNA maturation protein Rpf1
MPRIKKLCEQYDIKGLEVIAVVTENKERVAKIVATQKFPYSTLFGDKKQKNIINSKPPRYN